MKHINRDLKLLDQMWERSLTVNLIAERLDICRTESEPAQILKLMQSNNWDVIGFCQDPDAKQGATHFLKREQLETAQAVADLKPVAFTLEEIVPAETPIKQCLKRLIDQKRLFVIGNNGIDQIVTIADLEKQPVRMLLFAAVSLLEMAMLAKIRATYPEGSWQTFLRDKRIERAESLRAKRESLGQDIDLADCLQYCDKADILSQNHELLEVLGFHSKKQFNKQLNQIEKLRDNLAHGQSAAEGSDWTRVAESYFKSEEIIAALSDDFRASEEVSRLPQKAQKGSKVRCHWLLHGEPEVVAGRLSELIKPFGNVTVDDVWMPDGFEQLDEAQLHKTPGLFAKPDHCRVIRDWWFKIVRGGLQTAPSIDIASTCTVGGKTGLLLVEAKAHDLELIDEERGKPLKSEPSSGEQTNHDHIGGAIAKANEPLSDATSVEWSLSRDSRYQMSNRFATACKLTELGYPVIVVYLGFLNAEEMRFGGRTPLASYDEWSKLVTDHSAPLFPSAVWNRAYEVHGQPLIPLIRSVQIPHDRPCDAQLKVWS